MSVPNLVKRLETEDNHKPPRLKLINQHIISGSLVLSESQKSSICFKDSKRACRSSSSQVLQTSPSDFETIQPDQPEHQTEEREADNSSSNPAWVSGCSCELDRRQEIRLLCSSLQRLVSTTTSRIKLLDSTGGPLGL